LLRKHGNEIGIMTIPQFFIPVHVKLPLEKRALRENITLYDEKDHLFSLS
jgi:hypothetical protein